MSVAAHPFSSSLDDVAAEPLDAASNQKMWALFTVLVMCLTVGYWNMFEYTSSFWQKPLYSHGWIVPLFAVFLLFTRSGLELKLSSTELMVSSGISLVCLGVCALPFISDLSVPSWLVMIAVLVMTGLVFHHMSGVQLFE
ncbi:MAG: archaeosortase/exosortase family protein, partial [Pirellulales bacterium]|nr:archaeosortase/exosortase family protein [Pirellulales bacterium]